ncbi:unnamed protein product, partial [Ectocarpus sp. 6 AP-2014]
MVYVAHTCAHVGCSKRPTYGIKATRFGGTHIQYSKRSIFTYS